VKVNSLFVSISRLFTCSVQAKQEAGIKLRQLTFTAPSYVTEGKTVQLQ
jgi:hypothetical protein